MRTDKTRRNLVIESKLFGRYMKMGKDVFRRKNLSALYLDLQGFLYLRRQRGLWRVLDDALRLSPSTGCSFAELSTLHRHARDNKPRRILELGSGISTLVFAHACAANAAEGHSSLVTSMEESARYAEATAQLIPDDLKRYVDLLQSPTREKRFANGWVGKYYARVPKIDFDMLFIDGPELPDSSGEFRFFDSDILGVLSRQESPFVAFLDGRATTKKRLREEPRLKFTWGLFLSRFDTHPSQ